MMKNITLKIGFIFFILIVFASCEKGVPIPKGASNLSKINEWNTYSFTTNNSTIFTPRSNSLSCYNDSLIYILGSGDLGSQTNREIWRFNSKNSQIEKLSAQTPFNAVGAVSFMILGKMYFGLGVSSSGFSNNIRSDDKSIAWANTNFPGLARSNAISFVIGDKAYVGLGTNGSTYLRDFFEYNVITNSWKSVANFPGPGRQDASVFVINSKAYIGTGYNGISYFRDFWEFDPRKNAWRQVSDIPSFERDDAVAFAFEKRGYIGTGWNNYEGVLSDFWEYNPLSDVWKSAPKFESTGRLGAVAFTNKGKAYVGTGNSSIELNDFWVSK